ncbi:MAG: tRNA (adenosine(37)-N6)-threonylcarbamoyltransferase complex dimerization subunit type 1 TsaB [Candidatus Zixiibacteriota bacterium]
MKVLGVDTSTMAAGIGIVEEDEILVEVKFSVKITYSEILLSGIDQALNNVSLEINDMDGFAISIGPGSFTGLRIGLSILKGLSFAMGKPLASVPSLDALACLSLYCQYPVVTMLDAKKNQVYAAIYETKNGELKRQSDYLVIEVEDLIKRISQKTLFVGPGAKLYQKELIELLKEKACFSSAEQSLPSGATVALLGSRKLTSGQFEDIVNLEPIYLRKSEAELKFRNVRRSQ